MKTEKYSISKVPIFLTVNIPRSLQLTGFIFKCHYRAASSNKPWSRFQCLLLLDISGSIARILDGFQLCNYLGSELSKA